MAVSFRPPRPARAVLACLAAAVLVVTPHAAAQDASLAAPIEAALSRLGPHAVSAVRVVSLERGAVLYERNPDLSLAPASNMKLFTSAAALARLGPDYRFTTRVLAAGKRDRHGDLHGSLTLQGGGDPVLQTEHLEALADAVRAAGIRRLYGDLLADDYRYDAVRLGAGWPWDDEPFYYSAQISALSVNRGVVKLLIRPGGAPGQPARVSFQPYGGSLRLATEALTGAAGSPARITVDRARGRNEVRVSGSVPAGTTEAVEEEVTMEEPELYAASLFRSLLEARGVRVKGTVRRAPAPAASTEVGRHVSIPLSQIAALFNKPSDNVIGEMLLKELGRTRKQPGDAETGAAVVRAWLEEVGVPVSGFLQQDGSGLSRRNLVTARAVSELLARADRQPWRDVYLASLPVAGVDGTLRRRLKGTPAENNVRAKTGSLSRVTALAGYVTTAAGERLAFSILVNNYSGPAAGPEGAKAVEDAIARALVSHGAPAAGGE